MNGTEGKKYQIKSESAKDIKAATKTDCVVAFLENKANRNITTMPGVKNKVNSMWKSKRKKKINYSSNYT